MTVSTTINKVIRDGDGSNLTFSYTFKIFADADLDVYIRTAAGTETLKTLTTNYTVTGAGNTGGGNVVFVSGQAPADTEKVVIQRKLDLTQSTDYTPNDPFPAESHEEALDRLTFITQQIQEEVDRSIKASVGNTFTSSEFTIDATNRANKVFAFDSSGNLAVTQEIGTFQGTDATVTTEAYKQRDLIKSTTAARLDNIYICVADSVVGDSLTDTAHFALVVDAVSAATSATNAATSATKAENYAVKVDGAVPSTSDYSSKAWAVGGTGVTDSANGGAAKEWATSAEDDLVDGSEYSAKHYSIKAAASATATAADAISTAADKVSTNADVVLTNADVVSAQASATAASNSAAALAAALDGFDDKYLGPMADTDTASSASTTGTWVLGGSTITVDSATGIEIGQNVSATGIPNQANVLSVAGTTVTISHVATAAGSGAAVTFQGYGVYGAFDTSKDGPSTDNDNGALVSGALYYNTTDNEMRVYDGANWIAASAAGSASMNIFEYTVSGSPTATFSGPDDNSATLSYTQGNIQVVKDGVVLHADDFTATNGTSVVLQSNAAVGSEIVIYAFKSFTVADTVSRSSGGNFLGNIQINGADVATTGKAIAMAIVFGG